MVMLRQVLACISICAAFCLTPLQLQADTSLEDVARLAQAGARRLALQQMDTHQPPFATDPVAWMRWEQERIYILQAQRDWSGVIARAAQLPEGLADDMRLWMAAQTAAAALELGDTERVRSETRRLLWRAPETEGQANRMVWRRLIIQSYLRDARLEEADIALQRYRQDYGGADRDWRILNSRILLRTERYAEAARSATDSKDPEELAYQYLAQLRAATVAPDQVLAAARKQAENGKLDAGLRALHWEIIAEAAALNGNLRLRIEAGEQALALSREPVATDGVFGNAVDPLWRAYVAYGQQLGNQQQLLIGQDDAWYFAATDALAKDALAARALFATLAANSQNAQRRAVAHDYLAGSCLERKGGDALIEALYLKGTQFRKVDSIPAQVRYRLIDQALARNELALASRLMSGLEQPPNGSERLDWQLRRARVLILAGDTQAGAGILDQAITDSLPFQPGQLDRLVQVIFDLQKLGEHNTALQIFSRLLTTELAQQERRELLFWMGESQNALEQHATAARLFIESATVSDVFAMDQWAQTARYHAAEALVQAGFPEDAEFLYRSLLNATRDESRRAVLRHQIQQLRLMQGATEARSADL